MFQEESEYFHFASPQRLDRDLHMLEGIIKGIAIDNKITHEESESLRIWCLKHELISSKNPYNELIPAIIKATHDGIIDEEEKQDLLWLCNQYSTENNYYNWITADMQRLQGALAGIVADQKIEEKELSGLKKWLNNNDHLRTTWPYDEIDSLITDIMSDGKIDENEQAILLNFCNQFLQDFTGVVIDLPNDKEFLLTGVCSAAPEIEFNNNIFCLTGVPEKGTKNYLAKHIRELGGRAEDTLRRLSNYLVVGAKGSKCWACSFYGRKVESAMSFRKEGYPIQIVHEYDFWDAVEDMR